MANPAGWVSGSVLGQQFTDYDAYQRAQQEQRTRMIGLDAANPQQGAAPTAVPPPSYDALASMPTAAAPQAQQAPMSAAGMSGGIAPITPVAMPTPAAAPPASMVGLNAMTQQAVPTDTVNRGGMGGLRTGLGSRVPPQDSMALAGLQRRVY